MDVIAGDGVKNIIGIEQISRAGPGGSRNQGGGGGQGDVGGTHRGGCGHNTSS